MKNIKLSVLALTVFVATVVSASDKPVTPPVAPTSTSAAPSVDATKATGYFAKAKDAVSSAYTATKGNVCKLASTVNSNKLATAAVVVALGAAVVYRKEIAKLAKKAFNAIKNNPGKTAIAAALVAAAGAAHYYGYDAAAWNKVASLFSSKVAASATPVVEKVAEAGTEVLKTAATK